LTYNCDEGRAITSNKIRFTKPPKSVTRNQKQETRDQKPEIILKVAPNPASTNAAIIYKLPLRQGGAYSLDVYNMLGIKMSPIVVKNAEGSDRLQTVNWPNGIYNIILRENGKAIKTTQLIVAH
jgi:hypothetical protein